MNTISFLVLRLFLLTVILHLSNACGSGSKIGQHAGEKLGESLERSTATLAHTIRHIIDKLSRSFDQGVAEVGFTVRKVANSVVELGKRVSVRIDSGDLANIGNAASKNLKDALIELSKNWDIAINTADLKDVGAEAAKYLSQALQNINIKFDIAFGLNNNTLEAVKKTSEELGSTIRAVSQQLSQSLNNGFEETGKTVRAFADTVAELGKSVNIKFNSGDFATIGDAATKNLKDALIEMSKNWKLAVDTSDLKHIGAEAAKQLSLALQNLNLRLEIIISIDDNLKTAIGYVSIAGGIAFSVLFIAILISLRKCRSCVVILFNACIDRNSCCRNANSNATQKYDEEDQPAEDIQAKEKFLNHKPNTKQNKTKMHGVNIHDMEEDDVGEIKDGSINLPAMNKRYTASLADYDGFKLTKQFWNMTAVNQGNEYK